MERANLPALAVGISVALTMTSVSPANAADSVDNVSAVDVEASLGRAASPLVSEAINTASTAADAAVVTDGLNTVTIPRDPSDGVELTVDTASVSIRLPEVEEASAAVSLDSGAVTYPATNGVANTVIPRDGGLQMLTTIASAEAPTSFAYDVTVPEGGSISLVGDGSAVIVDAGGEPVLTTTTPWAVDANGNHVPTHYEIEGDSLVQIVEHAAGDHAYPIVADPTWGWRNAAWGLTLSRSETASIRDYAAAAGMCATIAKKAAGFAVACGVWASYLQVQAATANNLKPKGCLHVVVAPLPGAISNTHC